MGTHRNISLPPARGRIRSWGWLLLRGDRAMWDQATCALPLENVCQGVPRLRRSKIVLPQFSQPLRASSLRESGLKGLTYNSCGAPTALGMTDKARTRRSTERGVRRLVSSEFVGLRDCHDPFTPRPGAQKTVRKRKPCRCGRDDRQKISSGAEAQLATLLRWGLKPPPPREKS